MTHNTSPQSGFSTLEILIAMAIIVTSLSTVILVFFSNQSIAVDNDTNNFALIKAEKILEDAKASASVDFYGLAPASSSEDIFEKELTIQEINQCKSNGTATVTWNSSPLLSHTVSLETSFTNIEEALALGGDCGPENPPVDNWFWPRKDFEGDLQDYGAGSNGVGATSVDVIEKNGSKYMVLSTNKNAEKDIWILNVDDPENPVLTSSLETTANGINSIDIAGDYIFAAAHDSTNQFQVIDISTISSPALVSAQSLSGIIASGSAPQARKIYYYNDKVYIGTWETLGPEFHIFDVSNPLSPNQVGSRQLNHSMRDLVVRGDYAFIANSGDQNELTVLNISNPATILPSFPGVGNPEPWRFDAGGNYDGTALYVLGNKLYLGREGSYNNPAIHNFFILNIENPTSITVLGSKYMTRNPNSAMGITAINIAPRFAFIGSDDSNAEFQAWHVNDPSSIRSCSEPGFPGGFTDCGKYNFPAKVTDIEFLDDLVYASIESQKTFRIIFDNPICYTNPSDSSCNNN